MSEAIRIAETIIAQADGTLGGGVAMALPAYKDGIRGGVKVAMEHCMVTVKWNVLDLYDVTILTDRGVRSEAQNVYADQLADIIGMQVRLADRMANA